MKHTILTTRLIILLLSNGIIFTLYSQTDTLYYINTSFESTDDQAEWTSTPSHGVIYWKYQDGGANYPLHAKAGDINAFFGWNDPGLSPVRTLVSSPIDLSTAEKPELTFWHAQALSEFGQDELWLLLKAGASADWDTIIHYPNTTNDWTQHIFNIDEIDAKYLCEDLFIGFQGKANGGQGICLDSVVLKETAVIDKFIKSISYNNIDHELITSKMVQIPLIRVDVEVQGNDGTSTLNNIAFKLNSGNASHFKTNGFKLYHTTSPVYKNKINKFSTQIGSAESISGNTILFDAIAHELEIGTNYLWLSADIADDVPHNSSFTFGVDANSFSYKDTLLPQNTVNNIITSTVAEAVYYDNFSRDQGWTLDPDFAIDSVHGYSTQKSKDPSYAFSGDSILGTDISGDGMYLDGIDTDNSYHAISPLLDLHYYDDVKLYMRKWIDFDLLDKATISVTADNGQTWSTLWDSQSDNLSPSSEWDELIWEEETDALISRQDSVRIRFSVVHTDNFISASKAGFNIDNLILSGNYLDSDLGIAQIISPFDDCIGFNNDTVKVVVRNYADSNSIANIPVYFGLWGIDSVLVHDTIKTSILKDDSLVFTFAQTANFPRGDLYTDFVVGVNLPGDEDITNNILTKSLYIPDTYIPEYLEDFEYNDGIWKSTEGSSWICEVPSSLIPERPGSPNSWIQSPYGVYENNDTSYVTSGCYDLSFENRHVIKLDYWIVSELGKDGAAVEYSINEGLDWNLVEPTALGSNYNWHTSTADALGHEGWSGDSDGWITAQELLPGSLSTEIKVNFRLKWAADGQNNAQGFAFDNFHIYPAPPDVGVSTISIPKDTCQYSYPDTLQVWVKNYGYNNLRTNDTIIIGFDFESEAAEIDTFTLSSDVVPGDSIMFLINSSFDVNTPGTYNITAYTLVEDDPWFYGSNNDSVSKTFETWLNPITDLVDTISSRQPDTLYIEPRIEPEYSYLWGDATTTNTYDVQEPGTYYLTVTESVHGCKTYDSIYIELLFNDVGIDSIIWPQSSCELGSSENVMVQIRNFGTDSLIITDKVVLYYQLDGAPPVKDSVILDEALYEGATRWFTFNDATIDVSSPASYSIKAFTDYGGDTVPNNDTIERSFTVFGYPTLNLGNDTIIEDFSYDIDIDPSFVSYTWSDSVKIGSRTIDSSGLYTLDIVDVNGCPASDDIDIWFKIRDISALALITPVTECNRSGTDVVTIRIDNNGTDTIPITDDITVSYKINENTRVIEIVNIDGLLPGATYNHTFAGTVNLTTISDYNFNVIASTAGDLRINNDTINEVVKTNTNPVVNLPFIDNQVYYQVQMVIDAGSGDDYAYLWQDGSTNQTYTAVDRGPISVTVTDTVTGCFGSDSKNLFLDILDYVVNSVDIDATTCAGDYEDVDISILNNGNLPRQGAEIILDYYVNDIFLFRENFTTSGSWLAGDAREHTTQNTLTLEGSGSADFRIELEVVGDLRPDDDFERTYTLDPSPVIDLGDESQEVVFPYTLDAGSGYSAYLWSDGSTGSTFTATKTGTYTVVVTGSNSCQTTRTVYLTNNLSVSELALEIMDVNLYPNPASDYITVDAAFDDPGTYILEIYNAQDGIMIERKITEQEYKEEFYIGDMPAGLYFIRIRNNEMYHISKMIIQ